MQFGDIYNGRRVLVTGHAGFKGAWLTFWLQQLGARVVGYSLRPDTEHTMFDVLDLRGNMAASIIADIRDRETLNAVFQQYRPEMVFHLAAQPIVRLSYAEPVLTYETNVIGPLNVMEAARQTGSVRAFVNVTTDKCYENREIDYGYRETDPFGGHDMYSSSKGCSEILTSSYRRSFLAGGRPYALASARAGNVIGGGDWAADRLIPDCVRALVKNETIFIRSPIATRPWQHVLEPLSGYLRLGQRLMEQGDKFATGYNFGPELNQDVKVAQVAKIAARAWGGGRVEVGPSDGLHEATLLQLDNSKAKKELGIYPVMDACHAIEFSMEWYKRFYAKDTDMTQFTRGQIDEFVRMANAKKMEWSR